MALSRVTYTGNGSQVDFPFAFDLIPDDEIAWSNQIKVYVNGVLQTFTTDYSIVASPSKVTFVAAPANGTIVTVARETQNTSRYVDYVDNSVTDEDVFNRDSNQLFYLIQENLDDLEDAMIKDVSGAYWAGQGLEVKNASAGTSGNSLVTVSQMNAAVAGLNISEIDNLDTWVFSGDGSTTDFVLTDAPSGLTVAKQLFVSVSGVDQRPDDNEVDPVVTLDYDLDVTGAIRTLQFNTAPPTGTDNILVRTVSGSVVASSLPDGSITSDMIQDGQIDNDHLKMASGVDRRLLIVDANGNVDVRLGVAGDIVDFNDAVDLRRLNNLNIPTANYNMNTYKLTNLGTPSASGDSANKGYVDAAEARLQSQITGNQFSIGTMTISNNGDGTSSGSYTASFTVKLFMFMVSPSGTGDYLVPLFGTGYVHDIDGTNTATWASGTGSTVNVSLNYGTSGTVRCIAFGNGS